MSLSSRTDEPAFPVAGSLAHGLTVREYLAAKALQGLLATPDVLQRDEGSDVYATYARVACEYADALIAELAKTGPKRTRRGGAGRSRRRPESRRPAPGADPTLTEES